jgi:hypothetical protein
MKELWGCSVCDRRLKRAARKKAIPRPGPSQHDNEGDDFWGSMACLLMPVRVCGAREMNM